MRKFLTLLAVLMLCSFMASAQPKIITGRVTDIEGQPIPFASIAIKGSKTGTTADVDGNFSIRANVGSVLRISAANITAKEVTVTESSSQLNIQVSHVNTTLAEVVVTAFGIKKQKRELGYATTRISSDDVTKTKVINIASGLTGKVPGLVITQPNSGVNNDVRIVLRGNRSLLGNNQPILVVDGSVVSIGYLNSINPNDVDFYNILKGAAATALYGNAASNGAIVITTKKGNGNKPEIRVSSTINMESVSLMPELQKDFGSYGGEGLDALGHAPYIPYENQSYGPRYDGHMVPLGTPVRIFNKDGSYKDSTWMVPYSPTNARRKFFNNAFTYQNDVSFSSGDVNGGRFYVSAQDVRRNGTIPGDNAQRNTVRVNASKQINKITIGFNVGYSKSHSDVVAGDVFQNRPVYWSVLNTAAHVPLTLLKDTKNNPFATPSGFYNAYYANPYWAINNSRNNDWTDNILSNLEFFYHPLNWLTVSYRLSYNANFDNFEYFRQSARYEAWAKYYANNGFDIYPASGGQKATTSFYAPQGFRSKANTTNLGGDVLLSVEHSFIKDITAKLSLGQHIDQSAFTQDEVGRDVTGAINSYDDVGVWGPNFAIGQPLSFHTENKRRSIGVFGDLTLGYKNFLFLHGSARNDWDSRLEQNHRSFFYPSGDIAFIFTDAIPVLKSSNILSYGKLRASYAKVGLLQVGPYSTRDIYTPPAGFPFGNIVGYAVGGTFNQPLLTPEFTKEGEVGVELGWLNNRLFTDVSVFKQNATNQTLTVGISAASGRTQSLKNIGELQNRGIEVAVRGTIISTRNLKWDAAINYSYLENEVISIAPGVSELPLGGSVSAIVGSRYPIIKTTDWSRDSLGRIIVDAGTGLPSLDPKVKAFGSSQPLHTLGVTTSVSYENFTISALAEFRGGGHTFNAIGSDFDFTGISTNSVKFNREPFVIPNSVYFDGGKYVPNKNIITQTDAWNFWGNLYNSVGSNYVTSANFWKLREVAITYDFTKLLVSKTNISKVIKGASISLIGRDLFIWKPKENIWTDPEFSNTTGNALGVTDINQTPSTRKVGLSLGLTF